MESKECPSEMTQFRLVQVERTLVRVRNVAYSLVVFQALVLGEMIVFRITGG